MHMWVARIIGAWRSRPVRALGLVLCAAGFASARAAPAADGVLNVRFGGDQRETRVVIELNRPAKGRLILDGDTGGQVIIDLPGAPVASDLQGHGLGLVSGWTMSTAEGAARLKLQLTKPAQVRRRFLIPPSDGVAAYRYVIDLGADGTPAPPAPTMAFAAATQPSRPLVAPIGKVVRLHLKKVIVIDAGHGGKDPGALGASSREKDVNLAAARTLKAKLERTERYRVVMTRSSDTYVPLETRVQIARRADADLFISLHSDSGADPGLHGATVYTLSDKGSDRVVRGVMGQNDWFINVDLPGRDRAVNQILLDLTQRATRNRSAAFAEELLGHIGGRVDTQRRNHRDAGFVVLLAPDVPAVLLEMGFITNADDETLLTDADKRDDFMGAVAEAIDGYFHRGAELAVR